MFFKNRDGFLEMEINNIHPNPEQPRKSFSADELEELSRSIHEFGVLQPLVVTREEGGTCLLIAGERRLRAAQMAGLKKVPVLIRQSDEKEAALIALVENVQRQDLNYIEEAAAYKSLMLDFGLTQSEIAKRVGKQQSTISNKIRLLSLPDEVLAVLSKSHLTERHARALLRIPDNDDRGTIAARVASYNLNVKQTEKLVEDFLLKQESHRVRNQRMRHINYKIYINTLRKAFDSIKTATSGAEFIQNDIGDRVEIRIVLPKHAG